MELEVAENGYVNNYPDSIKIIYAKTYSSDDFVQ